MDALGQSEAFLQFQERLSRAARVDRPVLLIGERGTGKELAAHRLHYLSARWKEPFLTLNCAALSPGLIESELFGHEAGAFTGAVSRRTGRFEGADGGTLFLDEVGAIPAEVQEKILRVVEYQSFERVGSTQSISVDVRIVGATNADLRGLASTGQFKHDLLDRLSFEVVFVPPLRARGGDILLLANHFAARMAHELERPDPPEFSESAVRVLERHDWPGNIRELKNVVERAVYRSDGRVVREIILDPFESPYDDMPRPSRDEASPPGADWDFSLPFEEAVEKFRQTIIRAALERMRYNQRAAADLLGLSYDQFRGYYRKYKEQLR